MAITQEHRRIAITTPLGKDALLLRGFTGAEAMSRPYRFDLDLLSENDSIRFHDVVGKPVTVRIYDPNGNERKWHGFVSRFSQGAQDRRLTSYRAEMSPWLWFLSRTSDCRIFQNLNTPDIVQKIFQDLGFPDFELRLYGSYAARDYCVQYRETDLNFVSRLMEEEGISYFFEQQDAKHVLVLADDPTAHRPPPEQATVRYDFRGGNSPYEDVVTELVYEEEFRAGKWAQADYNFETPSTSLAVSVDGANSYEIYDYPGEYGARGAGERLAKIRLQEQRTPAVVFEGASGCRRFSAGARFTLQDHYRPDLNQAYLLTEVRHTATLGGSLEVGTGAAGGEEFTYRNTFECIPLETPYRPPRLTPTPFVQGCQTAVVVGPAGEEIYTDPYGRVKVQFHWDREGKRNENSSCWVRVSHPWAGQGWGAVSIPRIGQEVIVDFLEGDPDQPIVTGRVYNAEQMPPFGMPAGAVVSGVKSSSTKGGGGYNEISLDDTKGNELINIHAQFDQQKKVEHDERVTVGNDRTESVGHDEKITIGHNRTEKVGVDERIEIGGNRTETVGANETIAVFGNRDETVRNSEVVTVYLTRTHNVGINDMVNVGAAQEVAVGGDQTVNVGGKQDVNVGMSRTVEVLGSQTVTVGKDLNEGIQGNHTVAVKGEENLTVEGDRAETVGKKHRVEVKADREATIGANDALTVEKSLTLTGKQDITLQSGSAKIVLKSSGEIEISGANITVKATTSLKESGATIDSEASGTQTIKGALVKIN